MRSIPIAVLSEGVRQRSCWFKGNMKWLVPLLLCVSCACSSSQSSNTSSSAKKGDDSKRKAAAEIKVPDPHASKNPNVGREAGVGNDPNNLEVADPRTGEAGSGGRQAHATR